ncbi:TIGR02679 family protein [Rossellomorea sp. RS05]|uniref:TIGR02679 family protein n=1 Tax=Rossellomorea sp. RS05 TaxID=3149166 RepID=UPI003221CD72
MSDLNSLKQEPAFQKLFLAFKKKYESLGRIGGSVSLKRYDDEELRAISGLTGVPVEELKTKRSMTLLSFEKTLDQTKYRYDSLRAFLEAYFGEELIANKERERDEQERDAAFWTSLKDRHPMLAWYIEWIEGKSADTRWIWTMYRNDRAFVEDGLGVLEKGYSLLQEDHTYLRIPLFAQMVTGNPHAFDRGAVLGKWLSHFLTVDQLDQGAEVIFQKTTGEDMDLLGQYGLIRDDLWSFVTLRNLLTEAGGKLHPVWEAAAETGTVLNVPMKELLRLDRVYPAGGGNVWVVENSSVASTLMDLVPHAPVVCTHGQIRLAGWRLLELLAGEADVHIHYSGDLDPEGMMIAERLIRKFPEKVHLWRMDVQAYGESVSDEEISEKRLQKVRGLVHPTLKEVAMRMREEPRAGYQEALIGRLVEDMRKIHD